MFFLFMLCLLVIDQSSKGWVASIFPVNGVGKPLTLGLRLTYVKNTGAAFGMFDQGTLALALLSLTVSLGLFLFLLLRARSLTVLQRYALSSILAGAVGNMIDRFRLEYVIDFIHFKVGRFDFPVFNVADMCVVIGAGLLILSSFIQPKSPEPHTLSEVEAFERVE
jgi:signal peptidase II